MKTKIKRHSRAVMSVILAVSMLISCMTVGLIATDAAKVTGDEELGATYYIWKAESGGSTADNYTCLGTSPQTFSVTTGRNYYIAISTSATSISTGTVRLDGIDVSGVSTSATGTQGFDGKQGVYFAMASADTVKVSYSSGSKIKLEKGTASTECSTDKKYIVTGDQQLTNTTKWQNSWTGAGTRNQFTYNSAVGKYELKYTNIAENSSADDTFMFRILNVTSGSDPNWGKTMGYNQGSGAITDASNLLQTKTNNKDNNFKFSLSAKANITIYLDDSKLSTNSAIEVIVTPAVSTVTAGSAKVGSTVTAAAGTITVTNGTNVPYGGTVNLSASAGTDYVFSQWEDNANLSYANNKSATTTATVTGSTTVNAIFVPKSYSVSKGTGTGFTITEPSSTQSKQWGASVTVTAKADSLYALDYLYYLNNNTGSEVKIGADATSAEITNGTMTRTLSSMPKNNITVYAKVHARTKNNIKYGVTSDSPAGSGYVSVGEYYNSATTMKHTIDSDTDVIEGTQVNFGARPAVGYKFVGWFTNADGTGSAINNAGQDYTVTSPSGNYYAKFAASSFAPEYQKTKVYVVKRDNVKYAHYFSFDNPSGTDTNDNFSYNWPGEVINATNGWSEETIVYNNTTYECYSRVLTYKSTSGTNGQTKILVHNNAGTESGQDLIKQNKVYLINWDGTTNKSGTTFTDITNSDVATTAYFPVKYYVTNPDKGASTVHSNMFGQAGQSITFYHSPSDTSNWKTSRTTTGFVGDDLTNSKTTDASTSRTMPSTYSATPVFTATFVEKEYYKVTFSAGAGGTITAKAGGTAIQSGAMVQEGKQVIFTATPNAGNSVKGWTGSGTGTGTTRTISSLSGDATARVYFTASRGTETDATWFGYGYSNDPYYWTFSKTYVRDGHVYAYIDTIGTNKTFYIGAYKVNPDTTAKKYNEMYYFDDIGKVWCSTEFSTYVTNLGRDDNKDYNSKKCSEGKFTVSSAVKALIIDLGPDDGSGNAQTHVGDDNHSFKANNYRIIPVFNTDISKVSVYAKDASYRNNGTYDYLPGIANTVITEDSNVTGRIEHSEFETAVATKGQSITVTTTVDDDHKGRYYVRGYSVNGVTPELYEWNSDGEYSMTYDIPADFDDDYLEITPIYAEHNVTNVRFYIENYDEAFQNTGWGNTLAVYPFYENAEGSYAETKHNAFGGYPGQPVINNGGRRFIEVPTNYTTLTVDGTTEVCHVKGVTLSNDYFDIVHRDYCREVDDHLQTYDYDDFYKIYKETSDGKEVNGKTTAADQITFAFKYRTATNNFLDSSNTVSYSTTSKTVHAPYSSFTAEEKDTKFQNGWEPLLDYHDRPIDLFGKQLLNADQTKEPLLVVSDDYAITYAGRYATTWTVYHKNGTSYTKIAEIAPSALIVATQARLGTGTYPDVTDKDGFPSTDGHKLANYADEYQALKAYKDTPVLITYESAIRNNSSYEKYWSMTGGSSEVAKRSDGRWFYSYEGEIINADLRIDYTNEYKGDTTVWTTDTYKGDSNTGTVTGATVHFTNKSSDADGPYDLEDFHDTADSDVDIVSNFNHYYKFAATEGSGYIFMGWYMERDGIQTAVNADDIKKLTGQSQMTSNATFVARYVKNPAGHLTINHTMADGSTGTGTTYIGVEKSIDGTNWTWITGNESDHFERADMYSVTDTNVMSYNSGYTLRVTLKTVVATDTEFERFSANDDEHSPNYFSSDVTTSGDTSTTSFEIPVDDLFAVVDGFPKQQFDTLTYFSHTVKRPELTINHNIDPTSDSTAEGDTYVKVQVLSAGNAVVATYGGDEADKYAKGKDLVVPSTYFNGTDDYRIKVYLKTEMKGFTQFDHFSILSNVITNAPGPHGETVELTSSTDKRTMFATCTFSAKECYNRREFVLPYLSRLIVPDYKYEIKYTYPAYVKSYGDQSYTAKGSFAPEDLTEYMTLNNGDLAFQDNDKKLSFICKKAPYEDNFQKTIDFSKTTDIKGRGYSSTDYIMKLDISVEAENKQLSAYFDFPYATTPSNEFIPVVNGGKVIKADTNRRGKTDIYGRDWFVTNDVRHEGLPGNPEFVKAPLIIYDGNKPMYFQYWRVETEATDYNASREYTRCYDYEFNLAIFQNCVITPMYDEVPFETRGMPSPPTSYNDYGRFDPDVNRARYAVDGNGVSITFIENSRNQYNNGDSGTGVPSSRTGAADRIYSDFLLTFDNDPKVQLNQLAAGKKQAGLIIQPVAYLEKVNGEYVVNDDTHYSSTAGYGGLTPDQVKARILEGDFNGLAKSQFDVHRDPSDVNTGLDNKNRIQYYYGMNNATPKTSDAATDEDGILRVGDMNNNHAIVYKAFAYIGDGNGTGNLTNVIVGSQPVYFTIYNDAMIQPGKYMPNTSGN